MRPSIQRPVDADLPLLRAEYHACQEEKHSCNTRMWQATSILAAAVAGGAIVVAGVLSADSMHVPVKLTVLWGFTAGGIAACCFWVITLRREALLVWVTHVRMADIEAMLGLRRNIYADILLDWHQRHHNAYWCSLPESEQRWLERRVDKEKLGPMAPKRIYPIGVAAGFLAVAGFLVCGGVVTWALLSQG
jgi:hypothetical protein